MVQVGSGWYTAKLQIFARTMQEETGGMQIATKPPIEIAHARMYKNFFFKKVE